jgi:ribosomal protein L32
MGCGKFKQKRDKRRTEDQWKFQRIKEYEDNYGERKVVQII